MKKTLIMLLISNVILFITGCKLDITAHSEMSSFSTTERELYMYGKMAYLRQQHENSLLFDSFGCIIWEQEGTFVVAISADTENVTCSAIFEKNGQLLSQNGITTLSIDDIPSILHMRADELTSKLGNYHFDFGSGEYCPAYITDQGSVLVLHFEDGSVDRISEHRLTDGKTYSYGIDNPMSITTTVGN